MTRMFVPGPVDVPPDVLQAQAQPMLPHRSKEYEEIHRRAAEKAQQVFYTRHRVFLFAATGTGIQEAAVRNFANRSVLACVNGAFAERWYEVALTNGKEADKLEFPWEQPIDPQRVAEALRQKQYEVVTIVHNETSTGMQNPVREVAKVVRQISPETILCVDAVSSLGGAKIEMDAWGIDLLFTSSQKCLALPPGLALAAVSDRALEKAKQVEHRGWYFDFLRMEKHRLKDSTPATPAMSLIFALDYQLDRILNGEGLENRFARHSRMAQRVQEWAESQGLQIFAPPGFRSQTVTTIRNLEGWDISALNAFLKARGMRIANGYGALKNITFRIAHMAETQLSDIEDLLQALEEFRRTL